MTWERKEFCANSSDGLNVCLHTLVHSALKMLNYANVIEVLLIMKWQVKLCPAFVGSQKTHWDKILWVRELSFHPEGQMITIWLIFSIPTWRCLPFNLAKSNSFFSKVGMVYKLIWLLIARIFFNTLPNN